MLISINQKGSTMLNKINFMLMITLLCSCIDMNGASTCANASAACATTASKTTPSLLVAQIKTCPEIIDDGTLGGFLLQPHMKNFFLTPKGQQYLQHELFASAIQRTLNAQQQAPAAAANPPLAKPKIQRSRTA